MRQILEELHRRLEQSPEVDEETRSALRRTAEDIRDVLDETGPAGLGGEVRERLADALARFEGSHPLLTESVKRLVDQLAEMGI